MSALPPVVVPTQPVNSQTLQVALNNQSCRINVYVKQTYVPVVPSGGIPTSPPVYALTYPVYLDLYVSDSLVIAGVLCRNEVLIVRNAYLGFVGDLYWVDVTGGGADPAVAGLGTQFVLVYDPSQV